MVWIIVVILLSEKRLQSRGVLLPPWHPHCCLTTWTAELCGMPAEQSRYDKQLSQCTVWTVLISQYLMHSSRQAKLLRNIRVGRSAVLICFWCVYILEVLMTWQQSLHQSYHDVAMYVNRTVLALIKCTTRLNQYCEGRMSFVFMESIDDGFPWEVITWWQFGQALFTSTIHYYAFFMKYVICESSQLFSEAACSLERTSA